MPVLAINEHGSAVEIPQSEGHQKSLFRPEEAAQRVTVHAAGQVVVGSFDTKKLGFWPIGVQQRGSSDHGG